MPIQGTKIYIPLSLLNKVWVYLGEENIRWFKHIVGLKGKINVVLKLNSKRKRIPVHPIHLREGMQIRNFLRGQTECRDWSDEDFDNRWDMVIYALFSRTKR